MAAGLAAAFAGVPPVLKVLVQDPFRGSLDRLP